MELVLDKPSDISLLWSRRRDAMLQYTGAAWLDDERLVACVSGILKIYHTDTEGGREGECTAAVDGGSIPHEVKDFTVLPSGDILVLSRLTARSCAVISQYSSDLKFRKIFTNDFGEGTENMSLSCSEDRVAVMKSRRCQQIMWYSFSGAHTAVTSLNGMCNPTGIAYLADDSFVVCDPNAQLVSKLHMKPYPTSTIVWSSKSCTQPHSVATDSAGLVYVGSRNGGPIRVLCQSTGKNCHFYTR